MSFSFKNLGHYIAVAARDIVRFGAVAAKAEPVIEAVTAVVAPSAVEIERAGFAALGHLVHAADGVNAVANGTQTVTIQLAADEVNDFKALAAYFKGLAKSNGVPLPALSAAK